MAKAARETCHATRSPVRELFLFQVRAQGECRARRQVRGSLVQREPGHFLPGQRHLEFRRLGWLGSQFELVDPEAKEILAECKSSGMFTSSWDITCAAGSGRLAKRGWFDTAYEFIQKQQPRAWVDRRGMCDRGWVADGSEELTIYHTLRQRQARQHQGGPHVAGT
jgi:hypothetical protein